MPLEQKDKTINGRMYIVPQLPAMASLKLLARLGRVAGPAISAGLDADLGKAATLLFERLDENETEGLIKALCANVIVVADGKQRPMLTGFDLEYAGDGLPEVFQVLQFVLEVQYGPTFAALLAARAATQSAATPAASA